MFNISSIYYSVYRLGFDPIIVRNKKEFKEIDKLIIPGVGQKFWNIFIKLGYIQK